MMHYPPVSQQVFPRDQSNNSSHKLAINSYTCQHLVKTPLPLELTYIKRIATEKILQ